MIAALKCGCGSGVEAAETESSLKFLLSLFLVIRAGHTLYIGRSLDFCCKCSTNSYLRDEGIKDKSCSFCTGVA